MLIKCAHSKKSRWELYEKPGELGETPEELDETPEELDETPEGLYENFGEPEDTSQAE